MKIFTNYDFNGNQILNLSLQQLATAPSTPFLGQMYFNTTSKRTFTWNGTVWTGNDASDATMTGADIVSAINGSASLIDNDNLSTGVNTAITKAHDQAHKASHITGGADIIDNFTATASGLVPLGGAGSTKFLRQDGTWVIPTDTDTIYTHPTGDGNLHVPVNGTTNSGKVLTAGASAGIYTWNTPSVAWADVANKPSSAVADIDDAVSKRHSQNTDTGTSSATFMIGTGGSKLKNSAGEIQIRNNADNAYADLRVGNLVVEGTTTTVNSETIELADNQLLLNSNITTNAGNANGGIAVKRLMADNSTRKDAILEYDTSTEKWKSTFGAVTGTLVSTQLANKVSSAIGNAALTSIPVTHNLNTRECVVSIRETASPYAGVMCDWEFTDLNTITFKFAVAPTTNQFTVTIVG